jgi:hypothetical protein
MSKLKLLCTNCNVEQEVDKLIFEARRKAKAGLPYPCIDCGGDLFHTGDRVVSVATDSIRRSRKQERRVATREGGRRQPGSGARDGFEGDVRSVGKYRGECKFTRASSYSLKLADLKKLEAQSAAGELPVFDVEFQSESPPKRYVIMPEWVYETLMVESGRRVDVEHDPDDR